MLKKSMVSLRDCPKNHGPHEVWGPPTLRILKKCRVWAVKLPPVFLAVNFHGVENKRRGRAGVCVSIVSGEMDPRRATHLQLQRTQKSFSL